MAQVTAHETIFHEGSSPELHRNDFLVVEEPLEIRLNGQALSVTMRTPGEDKELVRGFLYTEQIIQKLEEILMCESTAPNIVEVRVPEAILEGKCWLRNFYASSSCGVCGKASIDQLKITRPVAKSSFCIELGHLYNVPTRMRKAQKIFEQTGGLHGAALFDSFGEIVTLREDVGRHNAVDKVIGWAMVSKKIPISDFGLFVSGRTSFEIMQKAIAAGISLVAAVSAPSSLAVELAREYRVTLLGFVRGKSLNVYADEEKRIKLRSAS